MKEYQQNIEFVGTLKNIFNEKADISERRLHLTPKASSLETYKEL